MKNSGKRDYQLFKDILWIIKYSQLIKILFDLIQK